MSTKGIFQRLLGQARYRPPQARPRRPAPETLGVRDTEPPGLQVSSQREPLRGLVSAQRGFSTTWAGQRLLVGTGVKVTPCKGCRRPHSLLRTGWCLALVVHRWRAFQIARS